MRWNRKGNFSKMTEIARLQGWEIAADKSWYSDSGYITRHWNWTNRYWMFWIGCLRGACSVSSFCDFRKITFRDFTAFFLQKTPFLTCVKKDTSKPLFFFQMFLLRSISASLCPNMIYFDKVNFSERRTEEMISFFWLSVYIDKIMIMAQIPAVCPPV